MKIVFKWLLVWVMVNALFINSEAIANKPVIKKPATSATVVKTVLKQNPKAAYHNDYCNHEFSWIDPHVPITASLLCVHGTSMHADSFAALGKRMSPLGIATYALDVRGFGPEPGSNKELRLDLKTTISDVEKMLQLIRKTYPNKPVYILGESMGGSIAIKVARLYPKSMDGIICADPAWHIFGEKLVKPKIVLAHVVGKDEISENEVRHFLKRAFSDPKLREHFLGSSWYRYDLSINEAETLLKFFHETGDNAEYMNNVPVLFMQALNDRVIKPTGTAKLFRILSSQDKTLILIGHSEHLLFEESQFSNQDITVLLKWMKEHIAASKTKVAKRGVYGALINSKGMDQAHVKEVDKLFKIANITKWQKY